MTEAVIINHNLSVIEGENSAGTPYVRVTGVYPFDAKMTFECGQCFRFNETDDFDREVFGCDVVYDGVAYGKYIKVGSPDLDTLVIEGSDGNDFFEIWYKFLGLSIDYAGIIEKIKEKWGPDSRIARAAAAGSGIRIMAQEPWEALISFIISQNNNIPRIKGIVERLCAAYGTPVPGNRDKYAFPIPRRLYEADVDGLFAQRMGFRARYVFDAAEKFTFDTDYVKDLLGAESFEEADEILRKIKGVGPKVSACVCLFGLSHLSAFPVDVWIRRTVGKYFPGEEPTKIDFGELSPYAGIIQQYIFNYERNVISE